MDNKVNPYKVVAVCVSKIKGTPKEAVPEVIVKKGYGIDGDAHAGEGHRQVSLLAVESADKLRDKIPDLIAGAFAENILTSGITLSKLPIGTRFYISDAIFEVTQIGKDCHNDGCAIKQKTGECVMPHEGIFTSVVKSGKIKAGDRIEIAERCL